MILAEAFVIKKGGETMDELDRKIMQLIILSENMDTLTGQYNYSDLFYALLDEVRELKPVYEKYRQQLLDQA